MARNCNFVSRTLIASVLLSVDTLAMAAEDVPLEGPIGGSLINLETN